MLTGHTYFSRELLFKISYATNKIVKKSKTLSLGYQSKDSSIVEVVENMSILETPASRLFLGANAQLLETSLAGAKMP